MTHALIYSGGMWGVRATVRASPDYQSATFDLHAGRLPLFTGAAATRDAFGQLTLDPAARRVLRRRFVTVHGVTPHATHIDVDATAPFMGRRTIRLDRVDATAATRATRANETPGAEVER